MSNEKDIQKSIEYDKKCGIAIDFIPNEKFREEIYNNSFLDALSKECREFVELCYKNKDKFYNDLQNLKYPEELKKYIK